MAREFRQRFAIGVLTTAALFVASAPTLAKSPFAATPAEAAASVEEQSRLAASAATAKRRAERGDYQLLYMYPDEATFLKLRAADLEIVIGHLRQATARLNELLVKRERLNERAEFYKDKPLPPDLQLEMHESDGSFTASMYLFRGLEQDVAHVVDKYERPRSRLEKLWAGAQLGSMGLYNPDAAASPK